jgi:hypothetical protein
MNGKLMHCLTPFNTMQTRSQTKMRNKANMMNETKRVSISSHFIIKTISNKNERKIVNTVKEYLAKCENTKGKCMKKNVTIDLFNYLVTDPICMLFLQNRTKFTCAVLLKLFDLKQAGDYLEWEYNYFIQKIKDQSWTPDNNTVWNLILDNKVKTIDWV